MDAYLWSLFRAFFHLFFVFLPPFFVCLFLDFVPKKKIVPGRGMVETCGSMYLFLLAHRLLGMLTFCLIGIAVVLCEQ